MYSLPEPQPPPTWDGDNNPLPLTPYCLGEWALGSVRPGFYSQLHHSLDI